MKHFLFIVTATILAVAMGLAFPCSAAKVHAWRDVDLIGTGPNGDTMQIMLSFYIEGTYDTIFIIDTLYDTSDVPVDVVLLLDNSGSMRQEIADAKDASEAFINKLSDIDRVAAITYSTASRIDTVAAFTGKSGFSDAIAAIRSELDAQGGYTAVWYSTKCAVDYVLSSVRNQTAPVLIVLTDGQDNASDSAGMGATPAEAYDSLMRFIQPIADKITLFTISLGDSTNTSELQELAAVTGGKYYLAGTSEELTAIYEAISDIMVSQTIDTTQTVTPMAVRQDTIGTFADALLLLDNSGSMKDEISDSKAASTAFINSLGSGDRIAAITYSTATNIHTIVSFTGQSGFNNAISTINSHLIGSGGTAVWYATKVGLDYLMSNVRSDAAPVAIVLTDGTDNASDDVGMGATPDAAYDSLMRYIQPIKSDVSIYTISLGNYTNEDKLTQLARTTGGSYYLAVDSKELEAIYQEISNVMILGVGARDISVEEIIPAKYQYIAGSLTPGPDNNTGIEAMNIEQNGQKLTWTASVVAMWGMLQVQYKLFVPSAYTGDVLDTALATRIDYKDNDFNEYSIIIGDGPFTVKAMPLAAGNIDRACRIKATDIRESLRLQGLQGAGPYAALTIRGLNGRKILMQSAEISASGEAAFRLPQGGAMPAGIYLLIIETTDRHFSLQFCYPGQ